MTSVRTSTRLRKRIRSVRDRWTGTLVRVRTAEPAVALTFDDGPDPDCTPALLELLASFGARATFFMIGRNAAANPELVRRVAEGGHAVGNHTWDHPRMPTLPDRERARQLRACASATAPYGTRLFRPPHTLQSVGSFLTARRLGYEVVAWSGQVDDWRPHDADWLERRLAEVIAPGKIIVLHDSLWQDGARAEPTGAADRGPLVQTLAATLRRLGGRFRFVTVPELMRLGRPVRRPWFYATDDDWRRDDD